MKLELETKGEEFWLTLFDAFTELVVFNNDSATLFLPLLLESNSLPYIVQIITGNYQHRATAESDVGQVDSQSNQSQIFPIVQNEGIVSLAFLCMSFFV